MKIAFLLIVHKNPEQINKFVNQLLNYEESYIFIHVDKKWNKGKDVIIKHERVCILDKSYDISWGDVSQIHVTLELLKVARNSGIELNYFSLHSGQDLAIKNINDFADFLKNNDGKTFLGGHANNHKLPLNNSSKDGFERFQLNYPKKRSGVMYKVKMFVINRLVYKLYFSDIIKGKKIIEMDYYKGSSWFTFTTEVVDYILNYTIENTDFVRMFDNSMCCDEIFFHTILFNSPLKDKVSLESYRYIDWSENKSNPKILMVEDFTKIVNRKDFFARKFDSEIDKNVIDKVVELTSH